MFNQLSNRDLITELWGADVLNAIDHQHTVPMTMDDFLSNHCYACGGNWGAMLLTGIKALYPDVYDAIPDNMGHYAFRCLCTVLELLQIKGDA
jgi:hypothetical protein